jgi:hypothetical protein
MAVNSMLSFLMNFGTKLNDLAQKLSSLLHKSKPIRANIGAMALL